MVTKQQAGAFADPEVLLIIGVVGGILGSIAAVTSFVLYGLATQVGTQIDSPPAVQMLQMIFSRVLQPEEIPE